MKWLYKAAGAANTLLMYAVSLLSFALMLCGVYVLNDIYYTNRSAFVSYDLLQYRPAPRDSQDGEPATLHKLKEINSDTVGWIELFDTHINYPVVQGKNDLEYLNKDIYGYSTMSGSIYLAANNQSDFNDWYNIIYGHHMDSGAMFGDIEKYLDPDYFASHSQGILQTADGDYSIHVIACIKTNAYENIIYNIQESAEVQYPELYEYINQHSVNQTELPEMLDGMQLLGLSTCMNAVTNGRIVLFASVKPWDTAKDGSAAARISSSSQAVPDPVLPLHRTAEGHKLSQNKWALLNLLCVCCTFLTLLPVWSPRLKYRQFSYAKKILRETERLHAEDGQLQVIHDLKRFLRLGTAGFIAEFVLFAVSVTVFLLTEDLKGRMAIENRWTGIMILIAAAALGVDFACMRYRGRRPETARCKE